MRPILTMEDPHLIVKTLARLGLTTKALPRAPAQVATLFQSA